MHRNIFDASCLQWNLPAEWRCFWSWLQVARAQVRASNGRMQRESSPPDEFPAKRRQKNRELYTLFSKKVHEFCVWVFTKTGNKYIPMKVMLLIRSIKLEADLCSRWPYLVKYEWWWKFSVCSIAWFLLTSCYIFFQKKSIGTAFLMWRNYLNFSCRISDKLLIIMNMS